jgi:predicted RNase H-like HicB family nuclease
VTFYENFLSCERVCQLRVIEEMKFKVVIEEDLEDGRYIVHCPALKGCWSQGDTIEEALENIKEAIVGYLKTLNERTMHDVKSSDKAIIKEVAVV